MKEVSADAPLFDDFIVAGLAHDAPGSASVVRKILYKFKPDDGGIDAKDIIEFCFPDLEDVHGPSESFTFTLTMVEGTRVFGFCRRLIQQGQLPICLCVISRRPWFLLFKELLNIVQGNFELTKFVPAFVPSAHAAAAVPGSGSRDLHIEPLLNGRAFWGRFTLSPPVDDRPTGVSFNELLSSLGPGGLTRVLGALMTEQKVVFSGARWGHVSACAHAATCLVYPFQWQHIYIPVLPTAKLSYASAPMPYVVGVLDRHLPALEAEDLDGVLFVDVDKGQLSATDAETLEMSTLPTPFREHLSAKLHGLQKAAKASKGAVDDGEVAEAVLGIMVRLLGAYKRFTIRGLGNVNGVHVDFDEEGFIQFAPPSAQAFLRAMRASQLFEVWLCDHVEMPEDQRGNSSFERAIVSCPRHELGGSFLLNNMPPPEKDSLKERASALKKIGMKKTGSAVIAGLRMGKAAAATMKEKASEIKVAELKEGLKKDIKKLASSRSPHISPFGPSSPSGGFGGGSAANERGSFGERGASVDPFGGSGAAAPVDPFAGQEDPFAGQEDPFAVDSPQQQPPPQTTSSTRGGPPPLVAGVAGSEEDLLLAMQQSELDAAAQASRSSDARRAEEDELQLALAISASLAEAGAPAAEAAPPPAAPPPVDLLGDEEALAVAAPTAVPYEELADLLGGSAPSDAFPLPPLVPPPPAAATAAVPPPASAALLDDSLAALMTPTPTLVAPTPAAPPAAAPAPIAAAPAYTAPVIERLAPGAAPDLSWLGKDAPPPSLLD